jgi:hypothetical protein
VPFCRINAEATNLLTHRAGLLITKIAPTALEHAGDNKPAY